MKKIIASILVLMLLTGCSKQTQESNISNETTPETVNNEVTSTEIVGLQDSLIQFDTTIKMDDTDWKTQSYTTINLNDDNTTVQGNGVSTESGKITISAAGTYVFSGKFNGQILVNVLTDDNVRIVLNGVELYNEEDAVIFVQSAKNTFLTLADGTINTIGDGSTYNSSTEASATIYSKDDLKISGNGTLNITANYNNAIQSKDDLFILSGTLNITATDKGLVGKDSVRIGGGNINITSGKDAIQSTNATEVLKGYVLITGGTINIKSDQDGIQAETDCLITGGTINITTGGGSSTVSKTNGGWNFNGKTTTSNSDVSVKGIKASDVLKITGGMFNIDSADDTIHSNNIIEITGGDFTLSSGDDGIHSDTKLTIDDGTILIKTSYEGIESAEIIINGGNIDLYATDDGLNAAGGNDGTTNTGPGGFGRDNFSSSTGTLTINGGNLLINADGDGLDSNGNLYMNGGTVIVYGPQDSGNGSLDFDGTFTLTGGTLVAVGSSGMLQTPSNSSTQYSIITTGASGPGTITIKDSAGNVLWSGENTKSFNAVLYSDATITNGSTYTILVNDKEIETITVSNIVSGTTSGGMQGGGMGGKQNPGQKPNRP